MNAANEKKREISARATSFSLKKGIIRLAFSFPGAKGKIKGVILKQRNTDPVHAFAFQIKKTRKGEKICYHCVLNTNAIPMETGFWDIVAIVDDGEVYEAVLGGQSTLRKLLLIAFPRWTKTKNNHIVYPFINGERHFTIQYREYQKKYDSWFFILKEYLALLCYLILKPYWDKKKIWFVCEKFCMMAQDNGYYFFRYCMEQLPESEKARIYYVIDKNSPDYQALEPYKEHVIQFMSFRYMILLNAAELLISSDAIRHFYIWDSPNTIYKTLYQVRKNIVFLQHGVMAFKQCHRTFHKNGGNRMALFVVSSEFEQEIIRKYFEYDKEEIIITGLPRWDVLHNTADDGHKEILIMPTWRVWMENVSEDEFLASDYFRNYKEFLTSDRLKGLLEAEDVYVNFYLHPKFKQYIGLFASDNDRVRLIPFGSEPLNKLLMSCHMMITDYSSTAWDVYYQEKPVIFYTFDREVYEEKQGSYVDMEKEGFGDVTADLDELFSYMEYYIKNKFCEKRKYAEKRDYLLPFRDAYNSQRIYQKIKETKFESKIKSRKIR